MKFKAFYKEFKKKRLMMSNLITGFFGVILDVGNSYLQAGLTFAAFFIIAEIFHFIIRKVLLRLAEKTKTKSDDEIIKKTGFPVTFLIILFGVLIALDSLEGIIEPVGTMKKWVISLIWFFALYSFNRIMGVAIRAWGNRVAKKTETNVNKDMIPLIRRTFALVIYLIILVVILRAWGVNVGPLLASLGIAGIAIGFAVQDSLKNIFGGVSLVFDKAYRIGDIVKLESGESGVIYDIGIRSTKIKNWDGELIIVPNGQLATMRIINLVKPDRSIKTTLNFGVDYKSDPKKVERIIRDVLNKVKTIAKEPTPSIRFDEMADFALKFRVMYWVEDISLRWDTKEEVMMNIWYAFKKNRINIPFPTRTVISKKR